MIARKTLLRLAGVFLAYTSSDARAAAARWPWLAVTSAPNALYRKNDWDLEEDTSGRDICFVGRLASEKRPLLLCQAFLQALPMDVSLHFVGAGCEETAIRELIANHGLEDRIQIHPATFAYDELRAIYATCCLSVSPGYAGLSLIQSLWFGVPMLISADEPHAPEIEAAKPTNTIFVNHGGSAKLLAAKLLSVVANRSLWEARRMEIAEHCRSTYNIEGMVQGFIVAERYAARKNS